MMQGTVLTSRNLWRVQFKLLKYEVTATAIFRSFRQGVGACCVEALGCFHGLTERSHRSLTTGEEDRVTPSLESYFHP